MKIEQINKNKIKVLIDDAEAKEWNITLKNISQNTPEVQKLFWHAIKIAEERTDFAVNGAKLFVETIPKCEDGIGMLITRVRSEEELDTAINNCSYKGKLKRTELRPSALRPVKKRKYIYRFDSFDTVCKAAEELRGHYSGISALYKLDNEFYLYLIPTEPVQIAEADILLSEFAVKLPHGQYIHGRLNEYGQKMIADNALGILNKYFA